MTDAVNMTALPDGGSQGIHQPAPVVLGTLDANYWKGPGSRGGAERAFVAQEVARPITATSYKGHDEDTDTIVASVVSNGDSHSGFRDEKGVVTHALTGEGFDAGEDGTGRGTPIIAAPVGGGADGAGRLSEDVPYNLAFAENQRGECVTGDVAHQLTTGGGKPGQGYPAVLAIRPRRLTPRECERLQGFPDDWTLIDGASDSARYRALGNAVAVPVVEWILRRLARVA